MPSRASLLAIISEVVLWATVVLVAWFGVQGVWGWYNQRFENGQHITLLFRDASQLMVGSPVHFMGTHIGFVTSVKPHNGRISVELKTYPHTVKIPKGAHFTIQFNSLAGAKTMEILPPKTRADFASDEYIVEEPMRLRDVMKTQMILAEALESSSNNMAQSLGEVQDGRVLMETLHHINARLDNYENQLEQSVSRMQGYLTAVHQFKVNSLDYVQGVVVAFHRMNILTCPTFFKSTAADTVRYAALGMEKTYQGFVTAKQEQALPRLEQRIARLDDRIIEMHRQTERILPKVLHGWVCLNTSLCRADGVLGHWQMSLQGKNLPLRIQQAQHTMENLNHKTRGLLEQSKP